MDTLSTFGESFFDGGLLYFIIRTIVILVIAHIIAKLFSNGFKRAEDKNGEQITALQFMGKVMHTVVYAVAVFVILSGIKPLEGLGTAILGATSVISVVIGLAAQESFGNFIAGFFLAIYHPFNVGDTIYLKDKDIQGVVEEITFRHTEIKTVGGTLYIIPNSVMNTEVIENKNYQRETYVNTLTVEVGYDTDIELAKKLIYEAALSNPKFVDVRSKEEKENGNPPFTVLVTNYNTNGIELSAYIHTANIYDSGMLLGTMRETLLKSFAENHIEIPYTKIDIVNHV